MHRAPVTITTHTHIQNVCISFLFHQTKMGNSVAAPIVFCCQLLHIACKRCYNFHCTTTRRTPPPPTTQTNTDLIVTYIYIFFSAILWLQWNVDGTYELHKYCDTGVAFGAAAHFLRRPTTFGCNFSQMSIMSFAMRWNFSFIWRHRIFFSSVPPLSHLIRSFLGQRT